MIAIRGETGITLPEVNPDILNITHNEELNYWLSKFVVEVRKKKDPSTFYPPNTLYQLCCGIQRYTRDNGRPELNFFTDTSFKHFQDCLDAEMKRLIAMGIGSNVKEAQAFSEDEENKLWKRVVGKLSYIYRKPSKQEQDKTSNNRTYKQRNKENIKAQKKV